MKKGEIYSYNMAHLTNSLHYFIITKVLKKEYDCLWLSQDIRHKERYFFDEDDTFVTNIFIGEL